MSLILSLRKPDCAKTTEIKSNMTDSMWQSTKVVYADSEPFLQTSEGVLTEPKEIIRYLQVLQSPSLLKQIDSARLAAVKAAKELATTGSALAPIEMVAHRREICMQCPYGERKFFLYKCSQCGCHIKPKTALITESCPIGKW